MNHAILYFSGYSSFPAECHRPAFSLYRVIHTAEFQLTLQTHAFIQTRQILFQKQHKKALL